MNKYIIGVDEVGRGCLAGPVVVCAFRMPMHKVRGLRCEVRGRIRTIPLKDSKQLSAIQREEWFEYFKKDKNVSWAIARVNSAIIDRINISRAANRAALLALKKLTRTSHLAPRTYTVFLDGGLYLGNANRGRVLTRTKRGKTQMEILSQSKSASSLRVFATTLIRGDENIPAISAASVMAKVTRDRLMTRLSKKYPQYGFEIHKGYGTKGHYAALKKHGPSEIHRRTFVKKMVH